MNHLDRGRTDVLGRRVPRRQYFDVVPCNGIHDVLQAVRRRPDFTKNDTLRPTTTFRGIFFSTSTRNERENEILGYSQSFHYDIFT